MKYSIRFINTRTGKVTLPDYTPMTHSEACALKSKFSYNPHRHIEIYQLPLLTKPLVSSSL